MVSRSPVHALVMMQCKLKMPGREVNQPAAPTDRNVSTQGRNSISPRQALRCCAQADEALGPATLDANLTQDVAPYSPRPLNNLLWPSKIRALDS